MKNMDTATTARLRQALLEIARSEDEMACAEAALVPYWAPQPPSVGGHRFAAGALRSEAHRLLLAT
jgi:hypothetical protein